MRISRRTANIIRFAMDDLLPPRLRDSWFFMYLPFRIVFGDRSALFARYKERAWQLDDAEFRALCEETIPALIDRATDLSPESEQMVVDSVVGDTALDVGCGRGRLAALLANPRRVVGVDLFARTTPDHVGPWVTFVQSDAQSLPFAAHSFDTVVCTHVLEHVRNVRAAVDELRRVARRRLVIVVPMQRPYRYTFDPHLHFFPFPEALMAAVGPARAARCVAVGGDLHYTEDLET